MPLEAATISEITMRMSASERLVRTPARILGGGARQNDPREPPASVSGTRAVSYFISSMERTPSMVFSKIGQAVPKAISSTRIWSPVPNNTRNIGISAGGGTARRNWMIGST